MNVTSSPIPEDSHVAFVQSVTGLDLPKKTRAYVENKHERFLLEDKKSAEDAGWYFSRHFAQLFLLPGRSFLLAVQIVADAAMLAVALTYNTFVLGTDKQWRNELMARGYNLFVADVLNVLAIPASLFHYNAFFGAESLHLGTVNRIYI